MKLTTTFRLFQVIIFCFLASCSANKTEAEQIFEDVLGRSDTKVLNDLVSFYDDFIDENYSKLEKGEGVHLFLKDIDEAKIQNLRFDAKLGCELLEKYRKSTLETKYETLKYKEAKEVIKGSETYLFIKQNGEETYHQNFDAEPFDYREAGDNHHVYLCGSFIKTLPKDSFLLEEVYILPPGKTVEAKVEENKQRGYPNFISDSHFIEAMDSIKCIYHEDDIFELEDYIGVIKAPGEISYWRLTAYLHKKYEAEKFNLDTYFLKRLIIYEIFLDYLYMKCDY